MAEVEIDGDAPTAVYRLYGTDGRLLYVGITHSLVARFAQHADEQHWWPEVTRKTVSWCGTREEALRAEWAAIGTENPVHNRNRPRKRKPRKPLHPGARQAPIPFRPPHDTRNWLTAYAEETGRPVNALLTEAVMDLRAKYDSGRLVLPTGGGPDA